MTLDAARLKAIVTADISGLQTNLRQASTDVGRFASDTDRQAKQAAGAFGAIGKAAGGLGSELKRGLEMGAGMAGFNLGLSGIQEAFAGTIQAASNWHTKLSEVQGNTTLTTRQTQEMDKAIRDMAAHSSASMTSLADGYMHITNLGYSSADATNILADAMKSAISTGGDVAKTADVLASVMREYNMDGSKAAATMDMLHLAAAEGNMTLDQFVESGRRSISTAANLGVPLQDVAAAYAALTRHGFDAATAGTQITGMLVHMINPSKATRDELAMLSKTSGIDLVGDFSGAGLKAKGLTGILEDLAKATHGNSDEVLKLIPALRGGQGALALTNAGLGDMRQVSGDLNQVIAGKLTPTEDANARTQGLLSFQVGILKNNLQIASITLAEKFLPPLTNLAVLGTRGLVWLLNGSGAKAFKELIPPEVATAAGGLADILTGPFASGVKDVIGYLSDHREVLAGIAASVGTLLVPALVSWTVAQVALTAAEIAGAAAFVLANAPLIAIAATVGLVTVGVIELVKHWDVITARFPLAGKAAHDAGVILGELKHIAVDLGGEVGKLASGLVSDLEKVPAWLKSHWHEIEPVIQAPFAGLAVLAVDAFGLGSKLKTAWDTISKDAIGAWTALKPKLTDNWDSLKTAAGVTFPAIGTAVGNAWDTASKKTSDVWGGIQTRLPAIWHDLQTSSGPAFDEVTAGLGRAWDAANTKSFSVWTGISTGIQSVLNDLPKKASSGLDSFTKLLDSTWATVKKNAESRWDGINSAIGAKHAGMLSVLKAPFEAFRDGVTVIMDAASNNLLAPLQGALNGIGDFVGGVADAMNHIGSELGLKQVMDASKWAVPQLPHFASGTRQFGGGLALVGEEGPEVVHIPRGSDVLPHDASAAFLAGVRAAAEGPGGSGTNPDATPFASGLPPEQEQQIRSYVRAASDVQRDEIRKLIAGGPDALYSQGFGPLSTSFMPGALAPIGPGMLAAIQPPIAKSIQEWLATAQDELTQVQVQAVAAAAVAAAQRQAPVTAAPGEPVKPDVTPVDVGVNWDRPRVKTLGWVMHQAGNDSDSGILGQFGKINAQPNFFIGQGGHIFQMVDPDGPKAPSATGVIHGPTARGKRLIDAGRALNPAFPDDVDLWLGATEHWTGGDPSTHQGTLPEAIIDATGRLGAYISKHFSIPADRDHFIAHSDINSIDPPWSNCPGWNDTTWNAVMDRIHHYLTLPVSQLQPGAQPAQPPGGNPQPTGGNTPAQPGDGGRPANQDPSWPGWDILDTAEKTKGTYLWCEKFVGDVLEGMGIPYARAESAEAHSRMQPLNQGPPPLGAVLFYPWVDTASGIAYGHVNFAGHNGESYGTVLPGTGGPPHAGPDTGWKPAGAFGTPKGWTTNPAPGHTGGAVPAPSPSANGSGLARIVHPGVMGQTEVDAAIQTALSAEGLSIDPTTLSFYRLLVQHESGNDPSANSADNPKDPNTIAGNPTLGLAQVLPGNFIDGTYGRQKIDNWPAPLYTGGQPRGHPINSGQWDLLDPTENIRASVEYAVKRYGGLSNIPGVVSMRQGGPYIPYADGGIINEPVVGIGLRSGSRYAIGERGPERVTPLGREQPQSVEYHYHMEAGAVSIPVKDLAEMKTVQDFFDRLQQVARARGVAS